MTGRTNSCYSPVNFKIVGGTEQPENPRENTIWVNTDAEITGWMFSVSAPSEPSEGMVWITVGTSSPVEMNILKKNNVTVYPLSAKQYVSGEWVIKTAQSYQGGAWADFMRLMLYDRGTEYIPWSGDGTMGDSSIDLKASTTAAKTHTTGVFDITSNQTLYVTYKYTWDESNGGAASAEIWDETQSTKLATLSLASGKNVSETTKTIDVSGISGNVVVTLRVALSNYGSSHLYLYELRMD